MHSDYIKILSKFKEEYGDKLGGSRFYAWLNKNKYDDSKPFPRSKESYYEILRFMHPKAKDKEAVRESFEWTAPIEFYKQKGAGRIYKVKTIHPTITGNRNEYIDEELNLAARSMAERPLTLDHLFGLDFPANKTLDAEWNTESEWVEALVYIEDPIINKMFDDGEIQKVSIEANMRYAEGKQLKGIVFTGLGLLTNRETPGDKLTDIQVWEKVREAIVNPSINEFEDNDIDSHLRDHPYRRDVNLSENNQEEKTMSDKTKTDTEKETKETETETVDETKVIEKIEPKTVKETKDKQTVDVNIKVSAPTPEKVEEKLKTIKEGKGQIIETTEAIKDPSDSAKFDYRSVVAESMRKYKHGSRIQESLQDQVVINGKVKEASYDSTAGGSAIPEIWANDVALLRDEEGVLSKIVDWRPDLKGKPGDTLNIPTLEPITFAAATEDSGATAQATTTSSVPVTLEERIAEVDITKNVMEDAVPDLITKLNKRLASAAEYDFDARVLARLNSPKSGAAIKGTLTEAGAMAATVIAKTIGSLQAGTYNPIGGYLIISPVQHASLLQDSQFTNAATYGDSLIIKGGKVQNYLGLNIIVTPQITTTGGTHRAYMVCREALAFANKRDMTIETDYNVQKRQHIIVGTYRFGGTIVHPLGVHEIKTVQT